MIVPFLLVDLSYILGSPDLLKQRIVPGAFMQGAASFQTLLKGVLDLSRVL
jgi:hypothetical protein